MTPKEAEEEIRQKREEIQMVRFQIEQHGVLAQKVWQRILAILEAQLAALLVGWKETP